MRKLVLLLALSGAAAAQAVSAQPGADAQAAYQRALMYRNGADAPLAVHWMAVAAREQMPEAMFLLSNMLAAGEGVAADPAAARRWLEAAAALGYPAALQELAMREPDPRQADLLMRQAAHALQHRP